MATPTPAVEKLKIWVAALLVVAVIYISAYAEMPANTRFGVALAGVVISALLVYFSQPGKDFFDYVRAAGIELRKVVWPSKQETAQLTGVVALFLLAVTLFLWLADIIINFFLDKII